MNKAIISLSVFIMLFLIIGCSADQVRESETSAVFKSIAISPDGQYIAAGRYGYNIIFLYDAKSLKIVKYFKGREEDLWGKYTAKSIDFSPDGKYLAASGMDDTVCIYDVSSGEEVLFLSELKKPNSLSFSPDGQILAVAGPDSSIRLIEVNTGEIKTTLKGHNGYAFSVAFSPTQNYLLSGGTDNILRLWDLQTKRQIANYEGHTAPIERIAFSSDGNRMISASKVELKEWQISSQSEAVDQFDTKGFKAQTDTLSVFVQLLGIVNFANSGLAYNPGTKITMEDPLSADYSLDGKYLAVTVPNLSFSGDYQLRIQNLATNNIVEVNGIFFALAVSPNSDYVATAGMSVKLWDLETGKKIVKKK